MDLAECLDGLTGSVAKLRGTCAVFETLAQLRAARIQTSLDVTSSPDRVIRA